MNTDDWEFMLAHMPAVRKILSSLPVGYFMDFAAAQPQQDMEQATDLVLEIIGGTMAVRVRRRKYLDNAKDFGLDWSIRYRNAGHKTEIHKLREGFADWYFYGYSANDIDAIAYWALIDLEMVRAAGMLAKENSYKWSMHDNGDGTAGMYIPIIELEKAGCIMDGSIYDTI